MQMSNGWIRLLLITIILQWCSNAHAVLLDNERFNSQALNEDLVYSIWLPSNYANDTKRYPVVYLLHGVGDNHKVWPNAGKVKHQIEKLVVSGQIPEMIVVMPGAKKSWYVDSSAVDGPGDFATAIREDLIKHIDVTYRTIAHRSGRAIAGQSMGGFGALRLAFERPDLFSATAALSPALWSHVDSQTVLNERQERIFDGSFGQPFNSERFLSQSPVAYLDRINLSPQELSIYLFAGDDDYFGVYDSTSKFYSLLRKSKIEAQLRIADGGHNWRYWSDTLPEVLSMFAEDFAQQTYTDHENIPLPAYTSPIISLTPQQTTARIVVPDDEINIAKAVATLPDEGGTVYVRASSGCYVIDEAIHIDRSNISLIGEQGASLCLADNVRQPVVLIGSAALDVQPDMHIFNIRVSGFTIDGNRRGQGKGEDAEDARGRPHLKNNAISVHGAQRVYLDDLVLQNARSGGVVISQKSRTIFINNVVLSANHFDGIAIDGGHEVFLSNFKAELNIASGVSIDTGSSEIYMTNGLLQKNGHNGVFIRHTKSASFQGLDIKDNCHHGVFASHSDDGTHIIPGSSVTELSFDHLSLLRSGKAGFYYGSNSSTPKDSAHNVLANARIGGNVDGPLAGDNQGLAELHVDFTLLSGMHKGPKDNPFCP